MNKDFTIEYLNSLKMNVTVYINEKNYIKKMVKGNVIYKDEIGIEHDVLNIPDLKDENKLVVDINGRLFEIEEYVKTNKNFFDKIGDKLKLFNFLSYKVNDCFYCCVSLENAMEVYQSTIKDIQTARVLELITSDEYRTLELKLRDNLNDFIIKISSINN